MRKLLNRRLIPIGALVAIAAATTLSVLGGSASGASATTVKLGDNFFKPTKRTVARGTRVRFQWTGSHPHNVTLVRGPVRGFSSPTTTRDGVNFAKRLTRPGTYRFICTVHPTQMHLTLVVR